MTFFAALHSQYSLQQDLELLLRIVISAACGTIIGVERSHRFKDAGVRTHSMGACTAAIMMIISKYGFADLTGEPGILYLGTRGADPARIAAQIVSGISFLGVGIIYRDKKLSTKGLTTAAGIWAVAGIGMAIGGGMYIVGLFSTVFIVSLQLLMHRFLIGNDRYTSAEMKIELDTGASALAELYDRFSKRGIIVNELGMTHANGSVICEFDAKMPSTDAQRRIMEDLAAMPSVHSISFENA